MAWAALGQLGGTALSYEANSREQRRQKELAERQASAINQMNQLGGQQDAADLNQLRGITAQRYASQRGLADTLGEQARGAAGQEAATAEAGKLRDALAGNQTAITRPNLGTTDNSFFGWGANASAKYAPLMNARMGLLSNEAGQGALARFDTAALDKNANTGIDLSRQSQQVGLNSQYLAAVRARMLAEASVQNADNGAPHSYYDLMLAGGLANMGGQVYGAYRDQQNQPHYQGAGGGYYYSDSPQYGGPGQLQGPPRT